MCVIDTLTSSKFSYTHNLYLDFMQILKAHPVFFIFVMVVNTGIDSSTVLSSRPLSSILISSFLILSAALTHKLNLLKKSFFCKKVKMFV